MTVTKQETAALDAGYANYVAALFQSFLTQTAMKQKNALEKFAAGIELARAGRQAAEKALNGASIAMVAPVRASAKPRGKAAKASAPPAKVSKAARKPAAKAKGGRRAK